MLAQLHLDSLEDKLTPRAVKAALLDLPKGSDALDVAYDQAMERINNQKAGFRDLADQTLSWIIFALRPLTVLELQHALAVELGDPELDEDNLLDANEMISSCAGLVVVDDESQIIRLVHYTTQEYFERVWEPRSISCHAKIAQTCLTYISFQGIRQRTAQVSKKRRDDGIIRKERLFIEFRFGSLLKNYVLLRYAAIHWTEHAGGLSFEPIRAKTLEFLSTSSTLIAATELRSWMDSYSFRLSHTFTALQFAAAFGSKELVEALLNTGLSAGAKEDTGTAPLHWAVHHGNHSVVKLLLNREDVNVNDFSSDFHGTVLTWAARRGRDTMLGDLLAHPDIDVNYANSRYDAPLIIAARWGHGNIVKMLLAHPNIDVNATSRHGHTALTGPTYHDDDKIVEMLLAHPDIKVNTVKDSTGSTALHLAVQQAHCSTVAALLACPDVEINAVDSKGYTPVLWAMKRGHVAVCKLLLSKDDVLVHPPSHYLQSNAGEWSLAAVRLWAMWDEGRIPEFSEAEREDLQKHGRLL